jgi:hypothetical protein
MMARSFFISHPSHDSQFGECKVIESKRLHDESCRWELVSQRMQANDDAIAQLRKRLLRAQQCLKALMLKGTDL